MKRSFLPSLLSLLSIFLCLCLWTVSLCSSPGGEAGASPKAPSPCGYQHCLQANHSGSGQGSLFQALTLAHKLRSSVEISVSAGVFNLTFNDLLTFEGWRNVSFRGAGMGDTVLQCEKGVGLVFSNSSHLFLRGFTLKHCARLMNTTSVYLESDTNSSQSHSGTRFVVSRTGVYFNSCSDLALSDVTVFNSSGMGVVVYNSNGTNSFTSCNFKSNHLNADDSFPGGGGVVIETSHCIPGDVNCTDNRTYLETSDASYVFKECTFASNRATSHYLPFETVYPHGRSHMGVGRGGGLAVIFKGCARRNKVVVNHCTFYTNRAEWGAALYVALGDTSVDNSILIQNHSSLFRNNFRDGREIDRYNTTVGGAVRIEIISYSPNPTLWPNYTSNVTGNSITVQDTSFNYNFATWGGAISFVTTRNVPGQVSSNSLEFDSCTFLGNQANIVGFALDVSAWKPDIVDSREQFTQPVIRDCTFESNEFAFENITHYLVGIGAVYIVDVPVIFAGSTHFLRNEGTALVVSETYISVAKSSAMNFTENSGRRGGALAFIGSSSWLVAHADSHFLFDGNHVGTYGLGGAVYSVHFGDHDLVYDQDCFFRYEDFALPPSRWNATFVFRDNIADRKQNSIYTTSSQPCTWRVVQSGKTLQPFCETSTWIFEGTGRNCSNEIETGPSKVVVSHINIHVVPGWAHTLGVSTINDFGKTVPAAFTASPAEDRDSENISVPHSSTYITDDSIVVYGRENTQGNLLLTTLDPRVIAGEVTIHVRPCPAGFKPMNCSAAAVEDYYSDKTCNCKCAGTPGIHCSDEHKNAYLMQLNCISYDRSRNTIVAAKCPYNRAKKIQLVNLTVDELEQSVCNSSNRKGFLCSECLDGYGVAVNQFDYGCVNCTGHQRYDWFLFLLVELGPITLVCFLVILLDVSVTIPAMNAFVFFSQIVSVTYSTNFSIWFFGVERIDKRLSYPLFTLYGVWNLEFLRNILPGICLHEGLHTLHILVINYVKALYPMVLLGVCYICVQLYDRNFRLLHILWAPFRKCQKMIYKNHKPKTSIVDAFATLIILSYTKFMYVSFPLVNLISVYEVGGNDTDADPMLQKYRYYFDPAQIVHHSTANIVYFLLGVIILVVFVGFFPIFLVLYPLWFVQACISRLRPRLQLSFRTFADAFLGAFRDGTDGGGGGGRDCRSFAGLYFILRILFMSLYAGIMDPTVGYLIQQIVCTFALFLFGLVRPYKTDFYNYLDMAFFGLLALVNSLSFYNSQLDARGLDIQLGVFYVNYVLMYLPLVYLALLATYHFLNWRGCSLVPRKGISRSGAVRSEMLTDASVASSSNADSLYDSDRWLPDRFVNPQNYQTLDRFSTRRSGSSGGRTSGGKGDGGGDKRDRQPSTDQPAAPLRGRQGEGEGYGSIQVQERGRTA